MLLIPFSLSVLLLAVAVAGAQQCKLVLQVQEVQGIAPEMPQGSSSATATPTQTSVTPTSTAPAVFNYGKDTIRGVNL